MNPVSYINLKNLVESPANVRRTGRADGIEGLAASIAAHGLRQNLNVRELEAEPGTFEVIAGQRRLLALRKLAEAGTIQWSERVPCFVLSSGDDATEISLAENQLRVAMHPDDQFQAFHDLAQAGTPVEDIAARFGVTPAVVKQRLKLAAVSPKLRAIFREGGMTLEQVMAFTLTDDHKRQEKVWKAGKDDHWGRQPSGIRRALMEKTTTADSKLAKFVGIEAYQAAGGEVVRDLFDTEHTGYLTDPALIERLATEKLEAVAADVRAEGWGWVEVLLERQWQHFDHLEPTVPAEMGEREDEDGDIEEYEVNPARYDPEQMKGAGARVVLGWNGEVEIQRGLVRGKQQEPQSRTDYTAPEPTKRQKTEFTALQVEEVTGHRTVALRYALSQNRRVGIVALTYALAVGLYRMKWLSAYSALRVSGNFEAATYQTPNKQECEAHDLIDKRKAYWAERMPKEREYLWQWCMEQDDDTLLDLIVFCSALTLDATIRRSTESPNESALQNADQIAEALGFDMAQHWRPGSAEGFAGGMSKSQLAKALTEVGKLEVAVAIAGMKKADAVREGGEALHGTGWVPGFIKAPVPACAGGDADDRADEEPAR